MDKMWKQKGFRIIKVSPLSDGWKKVYVINASESCEVYMMQDKDVEMVLNKEFIANSGGKASTNKVEQWVEHDGKAYSVWTSFNTLEYPSIINEDETI